VTLETAGRDADRYHNAVAARAEREVPAMFTGMKVQSYRLLISELLQKLLDTFW
jgi:hypothetical protein